MSADIESQIDFFKLVREMQRRIDVLEKGQIIQSLALTGTFSVPTASSDPATATNGQIYYNTTTHKFRGYANGAWVDLH